MKRSPHLFIGHQGLPVLFYRAALPLSRQTLTFTAGIIRRHRAAIGSLWRKLNPGQQALLVLVHLRKGEPFAQVAAGFGVGTATAWRYVTETVALLAARAPKLRQAVRDARKAGFPFAVLDGTLIRADRVAAGRQPRVRESSPGPDRPGARRLLHLARTRHPSPGGSSSRRRPPSG